MASNKLQAIRGMNDILPAKAALWQQAESVCQNVCAQFSYRRIRLPILEFTELFKRTIGDVTDIVEKEMYTFDDRNGDSLSLRPEGTAGCVRAGIEHGLLYRQIQRMCYMGPMFRHERPQKGRYRQFYQFGVEAFGLSGPAIDAELIAINAAIWRELGLLDSLRLEINSLGTLECRKAYRQRLVDFMRQNMAELDDDSKRRLETNPLRILDSKNPAMQQLIARAPVLSECLSAEAKAHHVELCAQLDRLGINFVENPHLVRGLDYYGLTVFEWVTDKLGAQGTVSAGGRYDVLVEQLGGAATPAAGFAIGLDRVVALLEEQTEVVDAAADIYVVCSNSVLLSGEALALAAEIRQQFPDLIVSSDLTGSAFKKQLRRADQSAAQYAVIVGDDELAADSVTLKALRIKTDQLQLPRAELLAKLAQLLSGE